MRRLSPALLVVFMCADLRAQVIDTATVPRDLVQALLGGMGYQALGPELVVGKAPDPAFAPLVPSGMMVIGGLSFPGLSRQFAVLVSPLMLDSATAIVRRHLERGGWSVPDVPEPRGQGLGGFGMDPSDPRIPLAFCRDSAAATVGRMRRPTGGTYVTITLAGQRGTACDPQMRQMYNRRAGYDEQIALPILSAPVDVNSTRSGSSSSGDGNRMITADYITNLSAAALVSHFGAQFVAAGWTASKMSGDADAAIQVFTRKDAKGQSVLATLTDVRTGGRNHYVAIKAQIQ